MNISSGVSAFPKSVFNPWRKSVFTTEHSEGTQREGPKHKKIFFSAISVTLGVESLFSVLKNVVGLDSRLRGNDSKERLGKLHFLP